MRITKRQLQRIIKEEYGLVEAEEAQKGKAQATYEMIKSMHAWVMKPENAWIRKMAAKMLGEKDLPEKEEVEVAKVQAEGLTSLYEEKGEGAMAAYKKLKSMYAWVMGDDNKWVRNLVIDMLKSGEMPSEDELGDEMKSDLPDNAKLWKGSIIGSDAKSLADKKVGDTTPTGRKVEDIEKTGEKYVFLMDDGEIETYAPSKKYSDYILVKESSAIRHRRILEAHKKLRVRKQLRKIIKEEIQGMQMYLPGMGGSDADADPNVLAASAFQYLDRKLDLDPNFSIRDLDEKFFKLLSNLYLQSGAGAIGGPSKRQIEEEILRFMSLDSEARKERIKYKLGS